MELIKTYHYRISGRVQGVAFRHYAMSKAMQLGVKGTVKNLPNGDVEVYAQGEEESILRFETFLNMGPSRAFVDRVFKEEIPLNAIYEGFNIVY